jgi:hypothetical protein
LDLTVGNNTRHRQPPSAVSSRASQRDIPRHPHQLSSHLSNHSPHHNTTPARRLPYTTYTIDSISRCAVSNTAINLLGRRPTASATAAMSSNNFSLDPSLYDESSADAKQQQQQHQQQPQQPPPPGMDGYHHAPMPHHQPQQSQQQSHQQQVMNVPAAVQEGAMPPQSDVDEFLRKKRKAREHKACYPCRQRKVKYVLLLSPRLHVLLLVVN